MPEERRHMTATSTESGRNDLLDNAWAKIRAHLERQRDLNYEQIKNYPMPIPGCDQQYNYLLEQRTSISRELTRLHDAINADRHAADRVELITDFIQSSSHVDAGIAREILSLLTQVR